MQNNVDIRVTAQQRAVQRLASYVPASSAASSVPASVRCNVHVQRPASSVPFIIPSSVQGPASSDMYSSVSHSVQVLSNMQ